MEKADLLISSCFTPSVFYIVHHKLYYFWYNTFFKNKKGRSAADKPQSSLKIQLFKFKCRGEMKKEHTPDGVTTLRGSRIVVCRRLDASLTLGSAHSLLCAVNRCEKDTKSFSLRLQVIRPPIRRKRRRSSLRCRRRWGSNPIRRRRQPKKISVNRNSLVCMLLIVYSFLFRQMQKQCFLS